MSETMDVRRTHEVGVGVENVDLGMSTLWHNFGMYPVMGTQDVEFRKRGI